MKTKTTALALAIGAAFAGHANAQSNVTLYGLIDTTISTISNANANGDRLTGYHQPAWFSGNRWGMTGAEDIGFGTKAIFKLESEFTSYDGKMDTPGVLFNRDAWVGVYNDVFGKLTFGRRERAGARPHRLRPLCRSLRAGRAGVRGRRLHQQQQLQAAGRSMPAAPPAPAWTMALCGRSRSTTASRPGRLQFGEVPLAVAQHNGERHSGYNGGNSHLSSFFTTANVRRATARTGRR
ncbi:porin [Cupriavidus basilensis]